MSQRSGDGCPKRMWSRGKKAGMTCIARFKLKPKANIFSISFSQDVFLVLYIPADSLDNRDPFNLI